MQQICRGVSSTATRLVAREVKTRDENEIEAAGTDGEEEEDDDIFTPAEKGGGKRLDGGRVASFEEQLNHLEVRCGWCFLPQMAYDTSSRHYKAPQCTRLAF